MARVDFFTQRAQLGIRGFSPQNLWRMRQFYDTYRAQMKLSTLLRELARGSGLSCELVEVGNLIVVARGQVLRAGLTQAFIS